jgi:U3 small nucleolar RNA-associated protein 6
MNLDSLRRKRVKRLGVKVTAHTGQRRIYFILDRATRKFHGDVGLWMQYIEYARKQKAYKKLSQILTNVLRLHPTKPELWIYAASYAIEEQADMSEARSYMQRGLRFCKSSKRLWLEYGKLEMIYIAKIAARRKILGLDGSRDKKPAGPILDDPDADMIAVPALTGEDINPSLGKNDAVDQVALQNLESTPALTGAIPIAIFDAAMKQFTNEESFGAEFYDMIAEFENVPCLPKILNHIVETFLQNPSSTYHSHIRDVKSAVVGVRTLSADFPAALGTALERLKSHLSQSNDDSRLCQEVISWLLPLSINEELDPGISKACLVTVRKMVRNIAKSCDRSVMGSNEITQLAALLRGAGLGEDADILSNASGALT